MFDDTYSVKRWAAGVAAVLAVVLFATPLAAAQDDERGELIAELRAATEVPFEIDVSADPWAASIVVVATDHGISIEEAAAAIEFQQELNGAILAAGGPDVFQWVSLDPFPARTADVVVARGQRVRSDEAMGWLRSQGVVIRRGQGLSYTKRQERAFEIVSLGDELGLDAVSVGLVGEAGYEVHVPLGSAISAERIALAHGRLVGRGEPLQPGQMTVQQRPVHELVGAPEVDYGGSAIKDVGNLNGVALCTAGFGVYDSNSGLVDSSGVPLTFGLLTAEHCDIYNHQTQTRPRRVINPVNGAVSTYDRGRTAMVNGQPVWFRGDAIVLHTGDFASHRVHATFNGVPVQIPIDHFGYPWDGTVLCAYGRRSNQVRCNMQVSGSWVWKNAGGQSHVGFNMFPTSGPDYMLPGDSGGPYYMGSAAYGVHQGQSTQGSAGSFMTGVALVLWAYNSELYLLAGS